MTVEKVTRSPIETAHQATLLAGVLAPGSVIGLEGPLGSGKTCFVRGLAAGLGLDPDEVSSPTFVICKIYGERGPVRLAHLDAFRLADAGELESVGWDELLERTDTIVAVEWASRVAAAMPAEHVAITFAHEGEDIRRLTLTASPAIESAWGGPGGRCPICGKPGSGDAQPFCSQRCRLVDLGRWMDEKYRIEP